MRVLQTEQSAWRRIQTAYETRYNQSQRRFRDTAAIIPAAARSTRAAPRILCKVGDDRKVVCARFASLIAAVDAPTVSAVFRDTEKVYRDMRLDPTKDILLKCSNVGWTAVSAGDVGAEDNQEVLDDVAEDDTSDLNEKCARIWNAIGSPGSGPLTGFTGATGLDTLSLGGMCGLGALSGGAISTQDMIAQFKKQNEAFNKQCHTTLAGSMMEGNGETPPPDDDEEEEETVTDNGDGTETVCVGKNCYVRYIKDQPAGGTNPTRKCDSAGVCTTKVTGLDATNEPYEYTETEYPDGTKTIVRQWQSGAASYEIRTPDGHKFGMFCALNVCTDAAAGPGENLPNLIEDWHFDKWRQLNNGLDAAWGDVGDCIDEACNSCRDQYQFMSDIKQDCITSGGHSPLCRNYMATADCCSNPNAYPTDPRLVMPNPDGALVCANAAAPNFMQSICEKKCSVASDIACLRNCSSSQHQLFEYDILDAFCTKAISESCFSSSNVIVVPGEHQGRSPRPPVPTSLTDRLLFPRPAEPDDPDEP